jgi:hypothetical protein
MIRGADSDRDESFQWLGEYAPTTEAYELTPGEPLAMPPETT